MNGFEMENNKLLKAQQLESEAHALRREVVNEEQRKKTAEEESLKKQNKVNAYTASDYAGLSCDKYSFYFGYEVTMCPKHKVKDECDDREWCFTAEKDGKQVMCIPQSELVPDWNDPAEVLLYGIGVFINKNTKNG